MWDKELKVFIADWVLSDAMNKESAKLHALLVQWFLQVNQFILASDFIFSDFHHKEDLSKNKLL